MRLGVSFGRSSYKKYFIKISRQQHQIPPYVLYHLESIYFRNVSWIWDMKIIEFLKSYAIGGSRKCCMVDNPGLKQTRGRNRRELMRSRQNIVPSKNWNSMYVSCTARREAEDLLGSKDDLIEEALVKIAASWPCEFQRGTPLAWRRGTA
jgi:hypothetical protein